MKESEIERVLVEEVKRLGGRAYKWTSPGNDGVPDRIVFLPDTRVIFVELKTDTGRLSPLQKIQIDRLKKIRSVGGSGERHPGSKNVFPGPGLYGYSVEDSHKV